MRARNRQFLDSLTPDFKCEDYHIEWIMERCDKSKTNTILRFEAIPAADKWQRYVIKKKEEPKSKACAIL